MAVDPKICTNEKYPLYGMYVYTLFTLTLIKYNYNAYVDRWEEHHPILQ